ncbi:unnamed protein product [Scytosiphon promiscuus]
MNGRGGNVYNKSSAKRKPSSLVLSRANATPGGAGGIVPGSSRQNIGNGSAGAGGVRAGPRGGQLQLQSVSRGVTPGPGRALPGQQEQQHRWDAGQVQTSQNKNTRPGVGEDANRQARSNSSGNGNVGDNGSQNNQGQQRNLVQGGGPLHQQQQHSRHGNHTPRQGGGSAVAGRGGERGHQTSAAGAKDQVSTGGGQMMVDNVPYQPVLRPGGAVPPRGRTPQQQGSSSMMQQHRNPTKTTTTTTTTARDKPKAFVAAAAAAAASTATATAY